ncbi:MAG: ATP-binding protein [Lachnospiraceae bacterium]|jgi:predicted AAA+ superfamily ATPase|nr:ATP-binding protein [Lachnospiraceae bacterium]
MRIERNDYLSKLISKKNNGLIKVVTGVRRCGKTYLLFNLFHDYLLANSVAESHIIKVALDDRSNKELRNPDNMLEYVKGRIKDNQVYYIIIDEVQMLDEFEDVLNSFLHIPNVDVYVTGSNSKFLSSDVITEFRGRGDEIRVHPLSFREYTSAYEGSVDEAWDDFLSYGGLPLILSMKTQEEKADYLQTLFQKVYLSDIIDRHKVRNKDELDELVSVLSSAIGSLTSPLKLSRTFKSVKNKTISDKTLSTYIGYLIDAFLISKSMRFDIKGKKYIGSPAKYYFVDVGLRNAKLNFRQMEENHIMENILYNELCIRGYRVDVGGVDYYASNSDGTRTKRQLEVDFVATKGSRKYYVQSAFSINDPNKERQEVRPLLSIGDSFKKIIVVRENIRERRNEDGIMTIGIYNFLLDADSLDR